jgi:L-ascorbate metabolism protein UlaG (beta-lactamase superfamily)
MKRIWAAGIGLALTACFSRPLVKPAGDPEVGVTVRWWGHSCFSFRDSADRVLFIDPFDDTVGYPAPKVKPDAVLVTHEHFDHDAVPKPVLPGGGSPPSSSEGDGRDLNKKQPRGAAAVPSSPFPVVRSTGTHIAAGVEIEGVLADHDNEGGRRNGTTRMYVWEMGGVRWAHLGDIGQTALRPDQKAALERIDVLFVPVGGRTTVDAAGAAALVKEIQPKVVIPMHYGTPRTRFFEFDPLGPFQALFEKVRLLPMGGFQIRRMDLPSETTVYVPAPPGDENSKGTP